MGKSSRRAEGSITKRGNSLRVRVGIPLDEVGKDGRRKRRFVSKTVPGIDGMARATAELVLERMLEIAEAEQSYDNEVARSGRIAANLEGELDRSGLELSDTYPIPLDGQMGSLEHLNVDAAAAEFLAHKADLSESQLGKYRWGFGIVSETPLGSTPLMQVSRPDVIACRKMIMNLPSKRRQMDDDGDLVFGEDGEQLYHRHTAATANTVVDHVAALFSWAIDEMGLVRGHPAKKIKKLKVESERTVAPDLEDVAEALRVVGEAEGGEKLAGYLWLAASTGLRIEEIGGLQWKHVDLDDMSLSVEQSNDRRPLKTKMAGAEQGETLMGRTKTSSSVRTVGFGQRVKDALSRLRAVQDFDAAERFKTIGDESFVFFQIPQRVQTHEGDTGTNKGKKYEYVENADGLLPHPNSESLSEWVQRQLREMPLGEYTTNSLRHFMATQADDGHTGRAISNRMGHIRARTTEGYKSAVSGADRAIAEDLEDRLS